MGIQTQPESAVGSACLVIYVEVTGSVNVNIHEAAAKLVPPSRIRRKTRILSITTGNEGQLATRAERVSVGKVQEIDSPVSAQHQIPPASEPVKVCAKFPEVDVKSKRESGSIITPCMLVGKADAGAAAAIETAAAAANKAFLKAVIL
jgi:hypothetical protein